MTYMTCITCITCPENVRLSTNNERALAEEGFSRELTRYYDSYAAYYCKMLDHDVTIYQAAILRVCYYLTSEGRNRECFRTFRPKKSGTWMERIVLSSSPSHANSMRFSAYTTTKAVFRKKPASSRPNFAYRLQGILRKHRELERGAPNPGPLHSGWKFSVFRLDWAQLTG